MRSITITEEQVKQYELPAKAVGDWSIVGKGDGYGLRTDWSYPNGAEQAYPLHRF